MGADHGFSVEGLELVGADGKPAADSARVSSTAIRLALRDGNLDAANAMLGRPHEVNGAWSATATSGAANSGFPDRERRSPRRHPLARLDGIYAGWFERADGTVLPTAISLGRRPTFYEQAHASLLEAHVLDFDGNPSTTRYVKVQLRCSVCGARKKFDSVEALVAQIGPERLRRGREILGDEARLIEVRPRPSPPQPCSGARSAPEPRVFAHQSGALGWERSTLRPRLRPLAEIRRPS